MKYGNLTTFKGKSSRSPEGAKSQSLVNLKGIPKLGFAFGLPQIIVNSVCPGFVRTDLAWSIASQSWQWKAIVQVYFAALGKSTDYGARLYVAAASTTKNNHMPILLANTPVYNKAEANMASTKEREVHDLVWREILGELTSKTPSL